MTQPGQKDLFEGRPVTHDAKHAEAEKDFGMQRVDNHAADEWREVMLRLVEDTAKAHQFFTADDVFDLYEARGLEQSTHDLRAFGPVMARAARFGFCKKADKAPRKSRRVSSHACPRIVWESMIHVAQNEG